MVLLDRKIQRSVIFSLVSILYCCVFSSCTPKVKQTETTYSKSKAYKLSDLLSDQAPSGQRLPTRRVSKTPRSKTFAFVRKLSRNTCYRLLKQQGVGFEVVSRKKAAGIRMPIRLKGTINGFRVTPYNKQISNRYLDCRMAVALTHWVKILSDYGFTSIEYSSIYRRNARVGGSSKVSGHAHGLAIDIGGFTFDDQRTLKVSDDWVERDRGDAPCSKEYDEPVSSQLMRRVVCDAATRKLFQVVLTPHFNRAHADHVHLELVPGVDWQYIR